MPLPMDVESQVAYPHPNCQAIPPGENGQDTEPSGHSGDGSLSGSARDGQLPRPRLFALCYLPGRTIQAALATGCRIALQIKHIQGVLKSKNEPPRLRLMLNHVLLRLNDAQDREYTAGHDRALSVDVEASALPACSTSTASAVQHQGATLLAFKRERRGCSSQSLRAEDPLERAGQCLFICIDRDGINQHALPVPCFRPTKWRKLRKTSLNLETNVISKSYERSRLSDRAGEDDSQLVARIKDTLFLDVGKWKTWLPYFGVIRAELIQFQILAPLSQGKVVVKIHKGEALSLDEEEKIMKQQVQRARGYSKEESSCTGFEYHIQNCPASKDEFLPCERRELDFKAEHGPKCRALSCGCDTEECIYKTARKAWLRGIPAIESFKGLPERISRPGQSHSQWLSYFLERYSCIYERTSPECEDMLPDHFDSGQSVEMHGIKLTLGWETQRMYRQLPSRMAWACVTGSVVWICVACWASATGDTETAMGFGAVVSAVAGLLFMASQRIPTG